MNPKRLLFVLILSVLLLSACAPAATPAPAYSGGKASPQAPAATSAPASGAASGPAAGLPRLVIKNASLDIVVESPNAALQSITDMTQQMGGYVVSSNSYKASASSGASLTQAKITLRVPAEMLNEALVKIRSLVKNADQDIQNETISGQDVTEEYTDLNSQVTNLQAAEKQLQAILEKATKTEDVLSIFHELTNTRQQIEVLQGKMKYYAQSAALSAIDVNILAAAAVAPIEIAGWQPLGIARNAVQTLIEVGKLLVTALIWIGIVFLPLGLVVYLPIRLLRRSRKPGKPTVPPTASGTLEEPK